MAIADTMVETIALAEAAVEQAAARAALDPFRPAFHFHPPAQWMNDICGALFFRGHYHVFYQWNPFADTVDWGSVNSCWGHARSRDLLHWEHLPIAIAPSRQEGIYQCASGSAVLREDGRPVLFYGHTPLPVDGVRQPRQQWAAEPLDDDLHAWRTFPIGLAPGQSGIPLDIRPSWTDMFVFRAEGRAFAIFKSADGLVVEAQNPALTRWQAVGRIEGVEGECPNFIALGQRWLLLRSTYPMTYQVGMFDAGRIAFDMDGPSGIVDYAYGLDPAADDLPAAGVAAGDAGEPAVQDARYYREAGGVLVCRSGAPAAHAIQRGFYATSVFTDAAGRPVLLGWVSAFRPHGWNGCMSLPRVLSLDAQGHLLQSPLPELAALRVEHAHVGPMQLTNGSIRLAGLAGSQLEVEVEVERTTLLEQSPDPAAALFELRLCERAGGTPALAIRWDGCALDANGTRVPLVLSGSPASLRLHLFFDRSLMELFINDGRQVVTRVVYPPSLDLCVEAAASGAPVSLQRLDAWTIQSAG